MLLWYYIGSKILVVIQLNIFSWKILHKMTRCIKSSWVWMCLTLLFLFHASRAFMTLNMISCHKIMQSPLFILGFLPIYMYLERGRWYFTRRSVNIITSRSRVCYHISNDNGCHNSIQKTLTNIYIHVMHTTMKLDHGNCVQEFFTRNLINGWHLILLIWSLFYIR